MPRHRTRHKGRASSSTDDSEEQKATNEIISKLSSTFLSNRKPGETAPNKQTIQQRPPRTRRRSPRLTTSTKAQTVTNGGSASEYDGDVETESDSAAATPVYMRHSQPVTSTPDTCTQGVNNNSTQKSVEIYDFDECADFPHLQLEFSPCKPKSGSKQVLKDVQNKISGKQRKTNALQGALKSIISQVTKSNKSRKGSAKSSYKKETTKRNIHKKKGGKQKIDTKPSAPPVVACPSSTDIFSNRLGKCNYSLQSIDSGVFTSPSPGGKKNSTSTPSLVTPSIIVKPNLQDESFLGTNDMVPYLPDLSPVKCVQTPTDVRGQFMSSPLPLYEAPSAKVKPVKRKHIEEEEDDVGYRTLDISKTYADRSFLGMYDRAVQKEKVTKNKKKKQKISTSKYDIMAAQLNDEFDKLDKYELDIE